MNRLTAGRRFTFAASRRLAREDWPADRNESVYGAGRERTLGSGENYQAHLFVTGPPDPETGMIVNLSDLKEAIAGAIEERYDHRFLNADTPPFAADPGSGSAPLPPTPENLALRLLDEASRACRNLPVRPTHCHLQESPATGATAYNSGSVEREFWISFSAARRTFSPHLSEGENLELFGAAASPLGHGHGYRLRIVLGGPLDPETGLIVPCARAHGALAALQRRLDHKNLNLEVPEWEGRPMTTECMARSIFRELSGDLPVSRVRLYETPEFFAEFDGRLTSLGLTRSFSAAHCLRNPKLTEEENVRIFGKCAHASGHGHRYSIEATVAGELDERTGTLFSLGRLEQALEETLRLYDQRHLDAEVEDFRSLLSTGENLLGVLWSRLEPRLDSKLTRLRLQETENNRFALRR